MKDFEMAVVFKTAAEARKKYNEIKKIIEG